MIRCSSTGIEIRDMMKGGVGEQESCAHPWVPSGPLKASVHQAQEMELEGGDPGPWSPAWRSSSGEGPEIS